MAYATAVKAQFNMGPTKPAIMPCFSAPDVPLRSIMCENYKLLGVQLEGDFSFKARADFICRARQALFTELKGVAGQAGFPPPVLSIAVIERIEPVMLYAAELLPLVPDIYGKLNTLQSSWAKSILADKAGTAIRGVLAVAAVGWSLRLASKAKVRALVYLAKIHLLPPEHPVARMTALAQTLVSGTWLHAVQDLKRQHGDLPLLQDSGVCSQEEVLAARMDRSVRKSILAAYKRHVVAPLFIGLDNKEFQTAAAKDGCCSTVGLRSPHGTVAGAAGCRIA